MNFFKKLTGKAVSKSSGCCSVEIKEVESTHGESCCGTPDTEPSCCGTTTNEQQSSCC
jgi:hypothetical protein